MWNAVLIEANVTSLLHRCVWLLCVRCRFLGDDEDDEDYLDDDAGSSEAKKAQAWIAKVS